MLPRLSGILCLLLLPALVWGQFADLPGNQAKMLAGYEFLAVPAGHLSGQQVLEPYWQQQFVPVGEHLLTAAGQDYWLRLGVHNPQADTALWWLDPWPTLPARLSVFYVDDSPSLLAAGLRHEISDAIPVILPPGDTFLYLHLQAGVAQPLQIRWLPDAQVSRTIQQRRWLSGAALGALSLLVLLAASFACFYRDAAYAGLAFWLLGINTWLWPVWASQQPSWLATAGLLISSGLLIALPGHTRSGPGGWLRTTLLGLLLLGLGLALLTQLPLASAALFTLTLHGLSLLLFAVWMLRAALAGEHGAFALACLQMPPLLVLVSLWLAADASPYSHFLPSPAVLAIYLCSGGGMLLVLLFRTRQRWADQEARQRLLAGIEGETRSRGDILGRISHEIRTPMSAILGMTELLQDSPLTAAQKDYVNTLQSSGQSLLNLIGEVLDDSGLTDSDRTAHHLPFEPEALITEVVSGFRNLAEQRQLELVCALPDNLPAVLNGDPVRLRQILLHLLGHALRNSSRHAVSLGLDCELQNGQAVLDFHIDDCGKPLPAEAIARILNPTGNAIARDPRLARVAGLTIAARLVQMLGSALRIDSQDGQGNRTAFRLTLPVELQNADQAGAATGTLQERRLLVVDDSDALSRMLVQQALRWGMQADTAATGSEALGRVRSRLAMAQPYDAILLDDQLPGMTGIELARRISQIQEPPPVMLMLTGLRHFPSPAEYQAVGIHRLLTKPVTNRTLRLALSAALACPPQAPAHDDGSQPTLRVLLAEDNPVTARVIEAMLKKLGADCQRVENGLQAVEACQRQGFDLLLMDCDMAVMDGYTATRRLRAWEQENARRPLPIYALTAHILDEYREKSRQAGMDGHLGKPVELAQLAAVLTQIRQARKTTAEPPE